MNTSILHSTGALLLEPINQMVIEVKLANKEPIPISYDTPADKVKGQSQLVLFVNTCTVYILIVNAYVPVHVEHQI